MESQRELPGSVPVAWARSRAAVVRYTARKRFFLKKEAKFSLFDTRLEQAHALDCKSFLVLFCKKEPLALLRCENKSPDQISRLNPRRGLNPAGNVHRGGAAFGNRVRHIVRRQPACQQPRKIRFPVS